MQGLVRLEGRGKSQSGYTRIETGTRRIQRRPSMSIILDSDQTCITDKVTQVIKSGFVRHTPVSSRNTGSG
jgi:hypothetical protein